MVMIQVNNSCINHYYPSLLGGSFLLHPRPSGTHAADTSQLPLAEGWSEVLDEATKSIYYWNATTQQSTWERPIATAGSVSSMDICSGDSKSASKKEDDDEEEKKQKALKAALEVRLMNVYYLGIRLCICAK